jgi:membrane protease YdiL (CAAX protease family)
MTQIESPFPLTDSEQYSRKKILGLWAAVTLPMVLFAFLIAPLLIPHIDIPPILLYWVLFTLGGIWEFLLALWIIHREEGNLHWDTIRARIWLHQPEDSRTGKTQLSGFLWIIPYGLITLFFLGLGVLIWGFLPFVFEFIPLPPALVQIAQLLMPASANALELASPEFSGKFWLAGIVCITWIFNTFFAEELFFRGILLPRMSGVFGQRDWIANALLFGLYYLFRPWMILFRVLDALFVAALVRRYRSLWMAITMRAVESLGVFLLIGYGVLASPPNLPTPLALPHIQRQPSAWACPWKTVADLTEISSESAFLLDVRCTDISALDLRSASVDPYSITFDDATSWPPASRMPSGVDWARILELGKNPGLGMRAVHQQGITGRGVGIAILDQILLTDHQEYAEQLRWYEEMNSFGETQASMHGPAVASIAVGKTVGVAPGADLYYIGLGDNPLTAIQVGHGYAAGLRRILEINRALPADRKIRVISISWGCSLTVSGCSDFLQAVREASAAGVFVISSNIEDTYGLKFNALGRNPMANPDQFESYEPGSWWADYFYRAMDAKEYSNFSGRLLVPMDSRTTASPTGTAQYVFYREGGWSWSIPYLAGMYALSVQADPDITPELFWATALRTGRTMELQHDGKTYQLGPILDPQALIAALKAAQ